METKDRSQSQGKCGQGNAPSDRNANPHSPDGERGEGNPRHPVRDPSRERQVMNREAPGEIKPRKNAGSGGKEESRQGGSQGHEADPPRPRREEDKEVPPYAGKDKRQSSATEKNKGQSDNR
jgi:hypothetical protein